MKIFGIGMNYAGHNKELPGPLLEQDEPVVFTKADSALLTGGRPFFLPSYTRRCEHEAELVVRISRLGRSIPERFAGRYYHEATVGVDFTARDLQTRLREKGLPWDLCKGFDGSAAVGEWVPVGEGTGLPDPQRLRFRLDVNGRTAQEGDAADMTFGIDRIVSFISRYFTLKTGDLIFTGTPAGVGPVSEGDHITGYLEGRKVLEFKVK